MRELAAVAMNCACRILGLKRRHDWAGASDLWVEGPYLLQPPSPVVLNCLFYVLHEHHRRHIMR